MSICGILNGKSFVLQFIIFLAIKNKYPKYSLSFKSPHGYAWVNYLEFVMCFHAHLKVLTVMHVWNAYQKFFLNKQVDSNPI